jgi:Protein of unknown function (DUF4031)
VTVYVYKLKGLHHFAPRADYHLPWFGLTADTEQELHPLAEQVGLYRHFYHPATVDSPGHVPGVGHYDLDQGERDQAVAKGAQPTTVRKLGKQRRKLGAGLGYKDP